MFALLVAVLEFLRDSDPNSSVQMMAWPCSCGNIIIHPNAGYCGGFCSACEQDEIAYWAIRKEEHRLAMAAGFEPF